MLDADAIVRQLQTRGEPLWLRYFETLGWAYVDFDGHLLRRKLSRRLFSDPSFRRQVNALVHPVVRDAITRSLTAFGQDVASPVVLDIPLLLESPWAKAVDEVWVVYATEDQQRQRIMDRDQLSPPEANQRIRSQMAMASKVAKADRVINNTASLTHLKREVCSLWEHVGGSAAVGEDFGDASDS